MILNSLKRGKDIILETTDKNNRAFQQYKSIVKSNQTKSDKANHISLKLKHPDKVIRFHSINKVFLIRI